MHVYTFTWVNNSVCIISNDSAGKGTHIKAQWHLQIVYMKFRRQWQAENNSLICLLQQNEILLQFAMLELAFQEDLKEESMRARFRDCAGMPGAGNQGNRLISDGGK